MRQLVQILQPTRLIKLSAYAGMIGPLFFGTMLTCLTFIEYDFLLSLGWDPLRAPTFDWPSGLALGRLGWLMTATFIVSGAAMMLFAYGLRVALRSLRCLRDCFLKAFCTRTRRISQIHTDKPFKNPRFSV